MILVRIKPEGQWHGTDRFVGNPSTRTFCGQHFDVAAPDASFRVREYLQQRELSLVCPRCLPRVLEWLATESGVAS